MTCNIQTITAPLQPNAPHSVYTVQCSLQCTVQCNHPLQFTAPHCTLCPVFTVQCNNISKLPRCNPMHFMFSISTNKINKLTALQHAFFLLLLCTALMSLCHSWIVLQFFNNSVFDPNNGLVSQHCCDTTVPLNFRSLEMGVLDSSYSSYIKTVAVKCHMQKLTSLKIRTKMRNGTDLINVCDVL